MSERSTRINRRDFVRSAAAVGMTTLTPAGVIARSAGSERTGGASRRRTSKHTTVKLTVANYMTGAAWPIDQVVKNYEAKNPNIKIEVSTAPTLTPEQEVQKYALEARNGTATYDAFLGATPWVDVANLAQAGAISPIDQYIPKKILHAMPKGVNHGGLYKGGKRYSLPFWADVVGFIYRKDYLTQARGSNTPPTTWTQLMSDANAVKQKYGPQISAYGADWTKAHRLYLPILVTYSKQAFSSNGLFTVKGEAAQMALRWIEKLYPFMPANSTAELGSSQTFQANKLAMETYWPAQLGRALSAGVPMDAMALTGNMKADRSATIFWTTDAVVFKNSKNKEEAIRFLVDGFLTNQFAIDQSRKILKIIPYTLPQLMASVPGWEAPLRKQLDNGLQPPMNIYYGAFESDAFTKEVEKMILKGQSINTTLSNLQQSFRQGLQDSQ